MRDIVTCVNDRTSLTKSILDGLPMPMALFDRKNELVYINNAFEEWFSKTENATENLDTSYDLINSLLSNELAQILKNTMSECKVNNIKKLNIRTRIDEHLICRVTFQTISMEGTIEGVMAVFEDRPAVTDVVDMYKKQANLDQLTGIANRFGFYDKYSKMNAIMKSDFLFGVVIIDIDDLKLINDNQGHLAGDKYIKNTASSLNRFLREGDILARWGGDEFIVVLLDVFSINHVEKLVERLVFCVHEHTLELGTPIRVSVGTALWKINGFNLDDLIAHADNKMYRDKRRNKNKKKLNTE